MSAPTPAAPVLAASLGATPAPTPSPTVLRLTTTARIIGGKFVEVDVRAKCSAAAVLKPWSHVDLVSCEVAVQLGPNADGFWCLAAVGRSIKGDELGIDTMVASDFATADYAQAGIPLRLRLDMPSPGMFGKELKQGYLANDPPSIFLKSDGCTADVKAVLGFLRCTVVVSCSGGVPNLALV